MHSFIAFMGLQALRFLGNSRLGNTYLLKLIFITEAIVF